jgi:hypothetical protein
MTATAATTNLVRAKVGYAADAHGHGVAYAGVSSRGSKALLLRVPFRVHRHPALLGREVGYAALSAVAETLIERGVRRVRLAIGDAELAADLDERRALPAALTLPYVRLGCSLNRFHEHEVIVDPDEDLAGRARAEVALHSAA